MFEVSTLNCAHLRTLACLRFRDTKPDPGTALICQWGHVSQLQCQRIGSGYWVELREKLGLFLSGSMSPSFVEADGMPSKVGSMYLMSLSSDRSPRLIKR